MVEDKDKKAFEYVEAAIDDKGDSHHNREKPGKMLAITDTACTKAVAGHDWYEECCRLCDKMGWQPEIVEEADKFKFGASRVHESHFAVWAHFSIRGRPFQAKIQSQVRQLS